MFLPPSLEELIAPNHPCRVVSKVVDAIDISYLLDNYKPGGTSVYHPRMLLKVLIYAYLENIFSTRKIEKALHEQVPMMWLAGYNKPDHNTIARFRSEKLKDCLKVIFGQIVELLAQQGILGIKTIYTDGTKMEANANKYSFVWGKAIKTNRAKMAKQLEELWEYTQQVAKTDLEQEKPDFTEIDRQKVERTVEKIQQALEGKQVARDKKQKITYISKHWPDRLDEYERKEAILGQRNSYSKTDHDATFMRTKDDHMRNGQLKACYNWQVSTSDQFIVNYSIHQSPGDTLTLNPHLTSYYSLYGHYPETICTDSGYGSEENYAFTAEHEIDAFVKYNYFHKEQTKKWQQNWFRGDRLHYNKESDVLICPMGQRMDKIGERVRQTASGFKQTLSRYQAKNCHGCPLRGMCHKAEGNRIVEINHGLRTHKQKARALLLSDQGLSHRKKRPADVEAVFGMIKQNKGFKRHLLRGKEKVEIELGLLAIAHNLSKSSKREAA